MRITSATVFTLFSILLMTPTFANECPQIKVTKPIVAEYHGAENSSIKINEMKLLYKSKSGHCLPTRDTYLMLQDNFEPKIVLKIAGHTPKVSFYQFDKGTLALIQFYAGNKLQVLKGYHFINNEFIEVNEFTLSSNVSHIIVSDNKKIELKNAKMKDNDVLIEKESFTFNYDALKKAH